MIQVHQNEDFIFIAGQNLFNLFISQSIHPIQSFYYIKASAWHCMIVIPERSRHLSIGISMQVNEFLGSVIKTINSFSFLISENSEKLLFKRLICDSSSLFGKPCKRISIKMRPNFKSMNVRGNRHIIVSYRDFCNCRRILSQISWIKVRASLPIWRFWFQKASLRIVDGWMIRDLINLIAIINFFIISLICYRHIYIINLVDPKDIDFFVSG